MRSQSRKVENGAWEKEYNPEGQVLPPTFQAKIIEAAQHNPILNGLGKMMGDVGSADSCHVWYHLL